MAVVPFKDNSEQKIADEAAAAEAQAELDARLATEQADKAKFKSIAGKGR